MILNQAFQDCSTLTPAPRTICGEVLGGDARIGKPAITIDAPMMATTRPELSTSNDLGAKAKGPWQTLPFCQVSAKRNALRGVDLASKPTIFLAEPRA